MHIGGAPASADCPSVYLPRLRHLEIVDESVAFIKAANWPIQAVTPALLTYKEYGIHTAMHGTFHTDVRNVTHLLTDHVFDLSNYVSLRVLQCVRMPEYAEEWITSLQGNSSWCPNLELVELTPELAQLQQRRILPVSRNAGTKFTIIYDQNLSIEAPRVTSVYDCESWMPCRTGCDSRTERW